MKRRRLTYRSQLRPANIAKGFEKALAELHRIERRSFLDELPEIGHVLSRQREMLETMYKDISDNVRAAMHTIRDAEIRRIIEEDREGV